MKYMMYIVSCIYRPFAMHDSPSAMMVKSGAYHKHLPAVKDWYSTQHNNWYMVDGERNIWHVWRQCQNIALNSALQIQQYLVRVTEGTVHAGCYIQYSRYTYIVPI